MNGSRSGHNLEKRSLEIRLLMWGIRENVIAGELILTLGQRRGRTKKSPLSKNSPEKNGLFKLIVKLPRENPKNSRSTEDERMALRNY